MTKNTPFPYLFRTLLLGAAAAGLLFLAPAREDAGRGRRSALAGRPVVPPLVFEPNRGQAPPEALFVARTRGYQVLLAERGALFAFRSGETLRMRVSGSQRATRASGAERLEGRSHYLRGDAPERWITGVPHYRKVRYRQVRPGVDWIFYGKQGELEHDLVVAPGADAAELALEWEGARSLRIDRAGDLRVALAGGELRQRRPYAFQQTASGQREVRADYVLLAENRVGFSLGEYDPTQPLVIDPVLEYGSYLGHNEADIANAVATDAEGNAYITGTTSSSQFATTDGALQRERSGDGDAFIIKLNPEGNAIVFSTFLGDTDFESGNAIAVDDNGDVYVAGETRSSNFPATVNGFQRRFGEGGSDAFVAKLDASGGSLIYSTFLGDTDRDWANAIAIDADRNAYVAGGTRSSQFPVTPGSFQPAFGGDTDVFLVKLDPNGTFLVFSTFLGGGRNEEGLGVAVDSAGQVYVTGFTRSNNFPVTASPLQERRKGDEDAFVAKLSASGASAVYSTYLGGDEPDFGNGIAADDAGNAYAGGFTRSDDFPRSRSPLDGSFNGNGDGFVTKLAPSGRPIVYSTYLGGEGEDTVNGIVADGGGTAYVAGHTKSQDFPVRPGSFQTRLGSADGDAFFAELRADGGALNDATYYGGNGLDEARAVARSAITGSVFVAGRTRSRDLPTTLSSIQPFPRSNDDGFVAKFAGVSVLTTVSAASFESGAAVAPESIVSGFGAGLALGEAAAASLPLPAELLGVRVVVTDSLGFERTAPLFFVSPRQVNFLIPAGTAPGAASIEVLRNGFAVARGAVEVQAVAPALFTANGSGMGVAAGVVLIVERPNAPIPAQFTFSNDPPGRRVPVAIDLGDPGDQVFLILFGTGIRAGNEFRAVIGNQEAEVRFAGEQGQFAGLDQVNILLPRSLMGRGVVEMVLVADGVASNAVTIAVR